MNTLFTWLYVTVNTFFANQTNRRLASARGANFIEYAMLGVVAIGLGVIFREQLSDAFNQILDKIRGGINAGDET